MKKALILVIAALALPSVALAAAKPAHVSASAPKVAYILKGKITAYTAYDKTTLTNGSVSIMIGRSNYHGKALHGQTLTFPVNAKTRVVLHMHKPIAVGDRALIMIRALKRIAPADLATTLQLSPAKQIIDMGAPKA